MFSFEKKRLDKTDEEVIAYIDEIEAEEEARIELADLARDGWK